MSNKLICPFCGKQMKIGMLDPDDCMGTVWMSIMPCDCVCSYGASKAVWQALIQTKQNLEIATKALEDITKVRCGLEDFEPKAVTMTRIAENALEQISPNRN